MIMADGLDVKRTAVTVSADNSYLIRKYKKKGYTIIGRVRVHKWFSVAGVSVR